MKRVLFSIVSFLFAALSLIPVPAVTAAEDARWYISDIIDKNTYEKWNFFSTIGTPPLFDKEYNKLSSYAAISGTEHISAVSSDMMAETYIANEIQDSVWGDLYLQAAYVRLDVVLDSGKELSLECAARNISDGAVCRLYVCEMDNFAKNDTIKHFASTHRLFIGLARYDQDYQMDHLNNLIKSFCSRGFYDQ